MKENVLSKLCQEISFDCTDEEVSKEISDIADVIGCVYSYLIYAKYKEGELTHWLVEYLVSQTKEYNTIDLRKTGYQIAKAIIVSRKDPEMRYVIGYRQPPEELMITLYEPLIDKLSCQQMRRWSQFDYEDLCQICRYVIIKLYRSGYYVHKRLIEKSFNNEVLMEIRPDKYKPIIVNIEDTLNSNLGEDADKLTIADMIPDLDDLHEKEDQLNKDSDALIFAELKDIIIDLIGPRRYDQLLMEYGTGNTTSSGRNLVVRIKRHLEEMGITRRDFNKKYHGG